MNSFDLKVIASDKVFFDGECESLVVPIFDGKLGVLAGHSNSVMTIETGEMSIKAKGGKKIKAFVSTGLMEILDGKVSIIVISAEKPEDIDAKRAKEAMQRAKEELRQKQSLREYYHSTASLARAMERLKVKKRFNDD